MKCRAANTLEDFSVRSAVESGQRKYSILRNSSSYRALKKFKELCHEKIYLKALKIKSVLFVCGLMVFNFLFCFVVKKTKSEVFTCFPKVGGLQISSANCKSAYLRT